MCTVVLLRRPGHAWPILLAANRDEMTARPSRPPARHWPDRPEVVAGLDELAGGTWLGVNDHGLVAAVMNRHGALGPAEGMRSRGELPLEALDHADARAAAAALSGIEARSYRAFNILVADDRDAYWAKGLGPEGDGRVALAPLASGLSMLTAHDLDDPASARIRLYLPRFRAAPVPDPDAGDWAAWTSLLAARDHAPDAGPEQAMTIRTAAGFGTVSSSLLALPSRARALAPVLWLYAPGPPDRTPFAAVATRPGASGATH